MKLILPALCAIGLTTMIVISCTDSANKTTVNSTDSTGASAMKGDTTASRGEYLVRIMGCHDCHTPLKMTPQGPAPDMDHMLSGAQAGTQLAPYDTTTTKGWVLMSMTMNSFVGPWGTSFAANITSDATGIGNWTFDNFRKALVEGKSKGMDGARTLLPPMPWQNFQHIDEADLKAIFNYLKSTKPISNIVPNPIPPGGHM